MPAATLEPTLAPAEAEARDLAAILELLDQVHRAPTLRRACQSLADELQVFLACHRAAVGVRRGGKGRCRLRAISGVATFDERSSAVQAMEAALDESILRGQAGCWPPLDDAPRHGLLAHKSLCVSSGAARILTTPLRDVRGETVGALLLMQDEAEQDGVDRLRWLRTAEQPLATALAAVQRGESGRLARWGRGLQRAVAGAQGKAAACALVLVLAALTIPWPYPIRCECRIEPVERRFVAAPFEGILEKSFAKPGDVVRGGDLLARMDGREVGWRRAAVEADLTQAAKKRDTARAAHQYADAQIAALEIQRLELQLRLLDHRAEHLEIRSPVDGVVAAGDLERAEGAPLTTGQSLFEIAPLERMIVEIAVPDRDIAYVQHGQPARVRLEALPGAVWEVHLGQIHPRAETRDEENVFIVEAPLDNPQNQLRPGMKGRARIAGPRKSLGWIVFHRPWEALRGAVGW